METFNRCSRDKWHMCSKNGNSNNGNLKAEIMMTGIYGGRPNFLIIHSLRIQSFDHLLEVGCGPYAKNTKYILETVKCRKVSLLDPLLDEYIKAQRICY